MKKLIILTILIACVIPYKSFSQLTAAQNETHVYQSLLDQVSFDKNRPIYYKTSLKTLKKIDFKKTDLHRWLRKDSVINWKPFFNEINLNSLSETELKFKLASHPFTKKLFEENEKGSSPFLILSPIIFSSDKNLAICSIFDWKGKEEASETIYLLELKDGKWIIVNFLLVSMA